MSPATIFNGNLVVMDAMVIINYHGLLALDKLISWAKREIVIEKVVRKEIELSGSMAGSIDLTEYIEGGSIIEEEITGQEQERLFYQYLGSTIEGTKIHKGDASCLALAISKGYGLACDELVIRNEFKKKCPGKICIHSWGIADEARKLGLITEDYANDLKKGFYYV